MRLPEPAEVDELLSRAADAPEAVDAQSASNLLWAAAKLRAGALRAGDLAQGFGPRGFYPQVHAAHGDELPERAWAEYGP